jgi:hypothetical protein
LYALLIQSGNDAAEILAENYPEYKWIRPIGYSFAGILMFEMMATKVHWAGDYPLALFLGYLILRPI